MLENLELEARFYRGMKSGLREAMKLIDDLSRDVEEKMDMFLKSKTQPDIEPSKLEGQFEILKYIYSELENYTDRAENVLIGIYVQQELEKANKIIKEASNG